MSGLPNLHKRALLHPKASKSSAYRHSKSANILGCLLFSRLRCSLQNQLIILLIIHGTYCWGIVRLHCYLSDDMQSFIWPLRVVKLAYGDWGLPWEGSLGKIHFLFLNEFQFESKHTSAGFSTQLNQSKQRYTQQTPSRVGCLYASLHIKNSFESDKQ